MAVNSGLLTSQLEKKLNDEDEELSARFKIAELLFTATTIPIIRKEEIIIEWLSNKIKEVGCRGSVMPYEIFHNCMSGPRLSKVTSEISKDVVVSMIKALTTPLDVVNNLVEEKRKQCVISVLSSSYFLNVFNRDVSLLTKLVQQYCSSSILTVSLPSEFQTVTCVISKFSEVCLLHEDLRLSFVNEMVVPLCCVFSKINDHFEENENCIYNCIVQLLFRENGFGEKFIESFATERNFEDISFLTELIVLLKEIPLSQPVNVVKILYNLFLKAVMRNTPDSHSLVFKMFVLLCAILGIKVDGGVIEMSPLKKFTIEESFSIIASMIDCLDKLKLSIDCTINDGVPLQFWLTSFIIGVSGIYRPEFSPEFLNMITSILKFNPMIIESSHKALCNNIMLRKKSDEIVKQEYVLFLKTVLDGSLLVGRLQKFICKMLECFKESLQFSCDIVFDVEDVIPKDITDHFCRAVSMLPGSQVIYTTKTLQFALHYLFTYKLESSVIGSEALIFSEIVVRLLNLFLTGVKIADFNTPTVFKDKFCSVISEIGESLQKFSSLIIDNSPNNRLLNCFLELCYCVGCSTLLMWEYDRDESRPLEESDSLPYNLNYVHSYIDCHIWEQIAKRVETSGSTDVKNSFYSLLMQKMAAVRQIEEGVNGPGVQTARYLLEHASPTWYWDNAVKFAPLLEDNELLGFLEGLIKSAGLDYTKWKMFISSDYFPRNKRIVVATSSVLLTALSKHIHKNRKNGAISHKIMSIVAIVPLLEYELARLFEDNEELESELQLFFEMMIVELETYLLEDPPTASCNEDFSIGGIVEIISSISHEDCSYAMEVCVLIAVISLLCDIPVGTNNDVLLLNKLNAFLKGPKSNTPAFLLNLHSGALLRFLVKRTEHYPEQRLLIQRFCNFSATNSYTIHLLIKYVKSPSVSTLWQTSAVIGALASHEKREGFSGPPKGKILKLLNASVSLLEKEEPSSQLLPDYYLTLKYVLKLNDSNVEMKLLKHLTEYLSLAITHYNEGKQLISLTLKERHSIAELPKTFLLDLWNNVVTVQNMEDSNILHHFYNCLSWEELKIVLSDLQNMMDEGISEPICQEKVSRCLLLWKGIIRADQVRDQKKEIGKALNLLMGSVMKLVTLWSEQSEPIVTPVLNFLIEINHSPCMLSFGSPILDMYLVILGLVPLEGAQTLNHLHLGIAALAALIMFKRSLMVDRLPPFLQIFRLYAKTLGKLSIPDLEEPFLFQTKLCADKLSKLAEIMVKSKKDFIRLSPYLVADFLNIFETSTIHPEVKIHFVNTLSSFFSILDNHGKSYLAATLNPACQELYKTYLEQYDKYDKYHGKI